MPSTPRSRTLLVSALSTVVVALGAGCGGAGTRNAGSPTAAAATSTSATHPGPTTRRTP